MAIVPVFHARYGPMEYFEDAGAQWTSAAVTRFTSYLGGMSKCLCQAEQKTATVWRTLSSASLRHESIVRVALFVIELDVTV